MVETLNGPIKSPETNLDVLIHKNGVVMPSYEATPFDGNIASDTDKDIVDKKNKFCDSAKKYLLEQGLKDKKAQRYIDGLNELVENMYRYRLNKSESITPQEEAFMTKDDKSINISATNTIKKEDYLTLAKKIDALNEICAQDNAKEKINTIYREQLNNEKFNDKGGAGLGFLRLARKDLSPISHSFEDLGNGFGQMTIAKGFALDKVKKVKEETSTDINNVIK